MSDKDLTTTDSQDKENTESGDPIKSTMPSQWGFGAPK